MLLKARIQTLRTFTGIRRGATCLQMTSDALADGTARCATGCADRRHRRNGRSRRGALSRSAGAGEAGDSAPKCNRTMKHTVIGQASQSADDFKPARKGWPGIEGYVTTLFARYCPDGGSQKIQMNLT